MQNKNNLSNNFTDLHLLDWDCEKIIYQLNSEEERELVVDKSEVKVFAKNNGYLLSSFPEIRDGVHKDNESDIPFEDWFLITFQSDSDIALEYLKYKLWQCTRFNRTLKKHYKLIKF